MRKGLLSFMIVTALIMSNIGNIKDSITQQFTSLNSVIDVGEELYVQHDENNNDVYDLKKSETGVTTVYKTVLPEFTAGKAWTTKGEFIDNSSTVPHGATSPENYIPVKEGEKYFIKTYGVGYTDGVWYAPVLFLDEKDAVVSDALTNTLSKSKSGVIVTVPANAVKMHFTMYNNQSFTLQKVLNLTEKEFDDLPIQRQQLEKEINTTYEEYEKDRTLYRKTDKAYVTFVNDDTRASVSEYADLFIEKEVPLVLATVPESLIENAYNQRETRLEVARRVEAAGGEIIAHNGGVLTKEGFSDYNTMYSFFVRTKQLFNYYGFDVNGIILAGGLGQVTGAQESEKWASSIYSYSDLYGVEYEKKEIALGSVYYHQRWGMGNYNSDLEKIKQEIDTAILNKSWVVFFFHDSSEIDTKVLGEVLDYVKSKPADELEAVTYREMYEKNAAKESEIVNTKHTYYVSSTGTSQVGTDEKDPMSYETAQKKVYISGDTIRFKKGDTFYGTFDPNVVKVDDKITTISSYGKGELPDITGYKLVTSKEAWQPDTEGIYKIDLTDTRCFSGMMTTDENSTNIGFLEDDKGVKFTSRKSALSDLKQEYDFYCDKKYLYIKTEENPFTTLGELKLATKTDLGILQSNMKIENIRFSGTGSHGLVNSGETIENLEISNTIVDDIGGSYVSGTTRYGNGIELYNADASNVLVKDNIIRNVYDVGFTMQGTKGSGKNIVVRDNVFVANTQDSEIWENGSATGIESYEFKYNLSINAGRGWGYEAREDKYNAAHILFWGYALDNTDIYFHHNTVYNPRRLYFIEQTYGTDSFFKEQNRIRSDYNTYLLTDTATIFRESYQLSEKDAFIAEYNKDANSKFSLIKEDETLIEMAKTSDNISEIKKLFGIEEAPTETVTPEPTVTQAPTAAEQPTVTVTQAPTATVTPEPTVTATQAPTATISPEPTVTVQATLPPEPTATVHLNPSPTRKLPALGDRFVDTKTKAVYTVTKTGKKNGTVAYTKPVEKGVTSVAIKKTVTKDGITYKVTAIAPNAFQNCRKLKKVTIGSNVTMLGVRSFYKCTALKKITIPSKVKSIGKQAFYGCKNLKKITIKTKKLKNTTVGSKAWKGIHPKATITVPKSKLKAYKKLLRESGAGKKIKVKGE